MLVLPEGWKQHPTGSNYICNPPVENTDIDFVVWAPDLKEADNILRVSGFDYRGFKTQDSYPNMVWSYRKGPINVVLTVLKDFYDKFVAATEEAKRLNLLKKEDRIALFDKYLYDN
jgi:hypothetical protein